MVEDSSSSETTILPDLQLYQPKAREDLSTGDLNESLANKIDLHMCNRETSILEPPAALKQKVTKTKCDKVNDCTDQILVEGILSIYSIQENNWNDSP